jgi:uncharacterized membrane protein YphA (DoxX/SURF4 family)
MTSAPAAVILIRLLAGGVFLEEGLQKFLFPELMGAGRFARIGIPAPQVMGPFVGTVEILAGSLLLLGLLTRPAAIALLINITVAILSTKIPILLGRGYWLFHLAKLPRYGPWAMLSEARADFSMFLSTLFLLIIGAGRWSLDGLLWGSRGRRKSVR